MNLGQAKEQKKRKPFSRRKNKEKKKNEKKFIRDSRDLSKTGDDALDDDANDEMISSISNLVVCFKSCFPNHFTDEYSHILDQIQA